MQTPHRAWRKFLGLGVVSALSSISITAWATPVTWGVGGTLATDGLLDATRIPTTTGTSTPILYGDVNGDDYDIAIYTSGLNRSGLDTFNSLPTWWLEGGTRSSLSQSIAYSSVEFRFLSLASSIAAPVTGVHFRIEDAEAEERFRNLIYLDATGNEVSIAYNSPLITYSSGTGTYHAADGSFDSKAKSESGTQTGKWIDINLGAIPITGLKFQTGRSLSSYGSVLMTGLGNITPFVNALGSSGTTVTGSYRGVSAVSPSGLSTLAALLDGAVTGTKTVSMQFNIADPVMFVAQDNGAATISSDILTLSGNDGDKFVLQLSYDEANLPVGFDESTLFLGWYDGVNFVNSVNGNHGTAEVVRTTPVLGAYNAATDFLLGNYGVDTENNTVWAVIDHNSDFAVTPAPEPTSAALVLCGALPLLARRRRKSA